MALLRHENVACATCARVSRQLNIFTVTETGARSYTSLGITAGGRYRDTKDLLDGDISPVQSTLNFHVISCCMVLLFDFTLHRVWKIPFPRGRYIAMIEENASQTYNNRPLVIDKWIKTKEQLAETSESLRGS